MYTELVSALKRVGDVNLIAVVAIVACMSSSSLGDDASEAEIRTLPIEPALDLVDITREILEHPLIHDENKPRYLDDLEALRQRLDALKRDLGSSYSDAVQRRRIDNAIQDIDRVVNRERPQRERPRNTPHIEFPENKSGPGEEPGNEAIGTSERIDLLRARLDNYRELVDDYSESIRDLYQQANEGEISRQQLGKRLHGKTGLDRKRQKILNQILGLETEYRDLVAQRAAENNAPNENATSVLDEMNLPSTLGVVIPHSGMTDWDKERASAAALADPITVAENLMSAMLRAFYPNAKPVRPRMQPPSKQSSLSEREF